MKYEINLIKVKLQPNFFSVYEVFFFGLNIHNIDHEITEKISFKSNEKIEIANVNKTYINENVENLKIKDYVNNNDDDHNCF